MSKRWLTIREVSEIEPVHRVRLLSAIHNNQIPARASKKCWYIDTQHQAYLNWMGKHKAWLLAHRNHPRYTKFIERWEKDNG